VTTSPGSSDKNRAKAIDRTKSKVFVVDDDESVVRALRRVLTLAGHDVETFSSAEAFLAREPFREWG